MASETETEKVISAEKLNSLLNTCARTQGKIDELSGGMGELIKRAADKDNLDPWVFRIFRSLDKAEEQKRAGRLRHLLIGLDMLEKTRWAPRSHVGDLVDEAEKKSSNVTRLKPKKSERKVDASVKAAADRAEERSRRKQSTAEAMKEAMDKDREKAADDLSKAPLLQ